MKKIKPFIFATALFFILSCLGVVPAAALTEDEVQQQVATEGSAAVTGNIFIWFLCSIAFLKVSQKVDSFMSSLGINVGHTGGSMLGEAMVAMRGIGLAAKGITGKSFGSSGGGGGSASADSSGNVAFAGGLAGIVSRKFSQGAAAAATGQGGHSVSRKAFDSSLAKGGAFANGVIGSVARGNIAKTGSITGDTAVKAFQSYIGMPGQDADTPPLYSNMEIGGGRITGTETSAAAPEGIPFAMYSAEQYMEPAGDFRTISAADGSRWYMQYAQDTVKREPYEAPDGKITYHESIVKQMPTMPRRKDKV